MKGAFDAYKVITINRQKFVDRRTAVLGTDNGGLQRNGAVGGDSVGNQRNQGTTKRRDRDNY
jgi:hypothetical protein